MSTEKKLHQLLWLHSINIEWIKKLNDFINKLKPKKTIYQSKIVLQNVNETFAEYETRLNGIFTEIGSTRLGVSQTSAHDGRLCTTIIFRTLKVMVLFLILASCEVKPKQSNEQKPSKMLLDSTSSQSEPITFSCSNEIVSLDHTYGYVNRGSLFFEPSRAEKGYRLTIKKGNRLLYLGHTNQNNLQRYIDLIRYEFPSVVLVLPIN